MFKKFLIFLIIFSIGIGFGSKYVKQNQTQEIKKEKNTPKAFTAEAANLFISEIYDQIKENYWNNISDAELKELFKVATDKNGGQVNASNAANIAQTVLASLPPTQRSGLFTQKQEEQLKNTVENINPDKDLYKDLGINKGASSAAVAKAYQEKIKTVESDEQLKQLTYAKGVLTKEDTKSRYDQNKVEPTIFAKVIKPGILYVQFKKFSPTSYDEFIKAFDDYKDDTTLTALIFDLRGNIGGAIDSTAYYLGNFIGKNISAFDFYHQGEYVPFKTPTDKLSSISKYKQIVILVDNQTQSSAEMMVASFKKYHIGVVLGAPTKGWGTVEKVFPLENQFDPNQKYSVFLVHSVTLREDNQPIEGRGVEPDVNIKDPNWEQQLYSYFRNPQLTSAVKQVLSNPD